MQRDEGWFGGDGSGKDVGGGAWQSPFRSNASTQVTQRDLEEARWRRHESGIRGDGSGKDVGGGAWQSPFRSNASTQVTQEEKKELRKRETVVLVAVEQTDSQKHQASESGTEETQPKHGHGADAA